MGGKLFFVLTIRVQVREGETFFFPISKFIFFEDNPFELGVTEKKAQAGIFCVFASF